MSLHTLIIARHAKSAWPAGVPDHQRPLNDRGRRDAPVMGEWLAGNDLVPDHAFVSPATRTRSTWELAATALPVPVPVRVVESMYAASEDDLLDVVRGADEELTTIVLVGHNPASEDLAGLLAGPDSDPDARSVLGLKFPTAALAVIDVPNPWAQVEPASGALRRFEIPRG
jgi:phosphohistidine phosphatase